MRNIAHLHVEPLSVPTLDPFVIATGQVQATRSILVRITLDGGDVGLGEGACLPPVTREDQPEALAAVHALNHTLLRRDAHPSIALAGVLEDLPVARAGVETALLDALSRNAKLPLWQWLQREVLKVQPAPAPEIITDITIPILTPHRMAELAGEWSAKGFKSFKLKVGRQLDHDLRALEEVLAKVPGAKLRPDGNAGLTVKEALAYADAVRRLGATLECFEQPCRTLDEMAEVTLALRGVPVVADESVKTPEDLDAVLKRKAASGVNLKIAKTGSLLGALEIGRRAKAEGLALMVGGMVETRLGMTAATHLAAALGGCELADLDTAWLLTSDPFEGGYREDGPRYSLDPAQHGLGVMLRPI